MTKPRELSSSLRRRRLLVMPLLTMRPQPLPAAGVNLQSQDFYVLFKWDGSPVATEKFGHGCGTTGRCGRASERSDEKKRPGAEPHVHGDLREHGETGGVLPTSHGIRGTHAKAEIALGLNGDVSGAEKKWVVLRDVGDD